MSNEAPEGAHSKDASNELAPWQKASLTDLLALDLEEPIASCNSADCLKLGELFDAARQRLDAIDPNTPGSRVFGLLGAVTGFHFKPGDRSEPFGPMFRSADRRSAIPEDFRGPPLAVIAEIADRAKNVTLRARFADLCWLLNRKDGSRATAALSAYLSIVRGIDAQTLSLRFDNEDGVLSHTVCGLLRRALHIGRTIGWDKPETLGARDLTNQIRGRAVTVGNANAVLWFSELDLDFRVSDPAQVGADIEDFIKQRKVDTTLHGIGLWRLAARAYHLGKLDDARYRCQTEGAEALVEEAERHQSSAMMASHWMSEAIREFHGIPNKKERRKELRHRLIDIQARIPDEMSSFSQTVDLTEMVEDAQRAMSGRALTDKLLIFASLTQSPDPEALRRTAIETIQKYPLSSLFGASHHDHDGKVIHRSEGGGFGAGNFDPAIRRQVAQDEDIRRNLTVGGSIEPARLSIMAEHHISEDVLASLLRYSPFVPNYLLMTFSRGFAGFFQGDFVSALYILTPLLENSLRHVLKSHGHDVTIFDDANQTQEDRTFSSLYEQMRPELEAVFGPAITADIENVFLLKPGPYLRHGVAHGLLRDGSPYSPDSIYGCWLIFRLCCIPLFPHRDQIQLLPIE